jgi:tetratricopeptide (TPR) repeat protein
VGAVFFERLRAEIAKYAEGVHHLGGPAPASALAKLPSELASFYRSWNGAELFIDAVNVWPVQSVWREDELLVFGETSTGDRLALDGAGRVLKIEEDTGETLVEGSSFSRWIEGLVAAEGVIYDREGEFNEDVFEKDSDELTPAAAEKRERRALKADPDAPAPAWRLAKALARLGQEAKARQLLRALTAREPGFCWAWFDLGRLERQVEDFDAAERCFSSAAEADPDYEHAGYFAAHAARAAKQRGDEPARARHAARALELDPDVAHAQKEAARRMVAEGEDRAAASEAAELASAVTPRDLEVLDLLDRARRLKRTD